MSEKVMNQAPGHVSTEPFLGAVGGAFPAPSLEIVPRAFSSPPRQVPARAAQPRANEGQELALVADFQATTINPAPPQPPTKPAGGQDWAAQIEQLRNDIFGIAMNVSALNDRLDRMEQRAPQTQAGHAMQSGIATLRGEIEHWLEKHLNGAVEHCMHRIISRPNSAAPQSVN